MEDFKIEVPLNLIFFSVKWYVVQLGRIDAILGALKLDIIKYIILIYNILQIIFLTHLKNQNWRKNRTSFSYSKRISGIWYFNIAKRSIPIPNA